MNPRLPTTGRMFIPEKWPGLRKTSEHGGVVTQPRALSSTLSMVVALNTSRLPGVEVVGSSSSAATGQGTLPEALLPESCGCHTCLEAFKKSLMPRVPLRLPALLSGTLYLQTISQKQPWHAGGADQKLRLWSACLEDQSLVFSIHTGQLISTLTPPDPGCVTRLSVFHRLLCTQEYTYTYT